MMILLRGVGKKLFLKTKVPKLIYIIRIMAIINSDDYTLAFSSCINFHPIEL